MSGFLERVAKRAAVRPPIVRLRPVAYFETERRAVRRGSVTGPTPGRAGVTRSFALEAEGPKDLASLAGSPATAAPQMRQDSPLTVQRTSADRSAPLTAQTEREAVAAQPRGISTPRPGAEGAQAVDAAAGRRYREDSSRTRRYSSEEAVDAPAPPIPRPPGESPAAPEDEPSEPAHANGADATIQHGALAAIVPALVRAGVLDTPDATLQRADEPNQQATDRPVVRVASRPQRRTANGDVQVNIARVEVVHPTQVVPAPATAPRRSRPTVDHDAYLAQRKARSP